MFGVSHLSSTFPQLFENTFLRRVVCSLGTNSKREFTKKAPIFTNNLKKAFIFCNLLKPFWSYGETNISSIFID